ncbi:MAG: hypothetical protein GKS00_28595 [Alphaproteobacteria bacterium]|nr:hypothetical protein [Alphaproteobacteria bacterium]
MVLAYKAVATGDGAVLASTKAQRFRVRDSDVLQAALNLDQALSAATQYLAQRVDGLEEVRIGDIRYRSETAETPFSHYLRDRVADEFRRGATGVLSASGLRVRSDGGGDETGPGVYRLIGTYWPLGRSVELSLSLRDRDGVAVTWRERIRTDSIPASLALGPKQESTPVVASVELPWQRTEPSPAPRRHPTRVAGRETVAEAQRLLHTLGYDPGPVDGILNPQMRRAIAAFQRNNGLGTDGRMTRALVASLRTRSR